METQQRQQQAPEEVHSGRQVAIRIAAFIFGIIGLMLLLKFITG